MSDERIARLAALLNSEYNCILQPTPSCVRDYCFDAYECKGCASYDDCKAEYDENAATDAIAAAMKEQHLDGEE